ncbi:peptide/nickel transport system permease protein [Bradyrhizobium sp. JR4.1]
MSSISAEKVLPSSRMRRLWWWRDRAIGIAVTWLVIMLLVAVFADRLAPYDYAALDLHHRLAAPLGLGGTIAHPFGSDELGRDVLARLVISIRISLLIAFGATLIGAVLGITLGVLAAHFRSWVEQVILGCVDFQASMPFLVLALAVLAFFGNSLLLFVGLIGLHGWERYARITRALAMSSNEQAYVIAVRQLGATPRRVYLRHIMPNIASTLIVTVTLAFPDIILLESGLSFLGLGVQPPFTSLGNMVGYGRDYLTRAPWILVLPSLVISLTALSISFVGDWLRDRIDKTLS